MFDFNELLGLTNFCANQHSENYKKFISIFLFDRYTRIVYYNKLFNAALLFMIVTRAVGRRMSNENNTVQIGSISLCQVICQVMGHSLSVKIKFEKKKEEEKTLIKLFLCYYLVIYIIFFLFALLSKQIYINTYIC